MKFMCFLFEEMKLSEYFQQQQSQHLSSQMKSDIFFRIQKEKLIWSTLPESLNTKKFFVASKHFVYSSLAAFIAIIVFWGLILDKKDVIDLWSFSIHPSNPMAVHAGYVAEIIEFNWDYSIIREDKRLWLDLFAKNLINEWDIIQLVEWTEMIFTLEDWTKARIDWPAELSIEKTLNWYQISLIYWKFFRIYCPECNSEIDILTSETSIHQDINQLLDLQIVNQDDKVLVKNNGDDVIIKSNTTNDSKQVRTENLISINSNWDTIDILNSSNIMEAFMNDNNISWTFNLSDEQPNWPIIKDKPSKDNLAINTNTENQTSSDNTTSTLNNDSAETEDPFLQEIIGVISSDVDSENIDENISQELWINADSQQVPSESQMQSLKQNLNSFFLMNIFESIYTKEKSEQSISQLAERVNSVASSFGYSSHSESDLNNIKWLALTLQSELEKDWYIAPSYLLQLQKIANWCDKLMQNAEDNNQSWNDFVSDLPINLRLM